MEFVFNGSPLDGVIRYLVNHSRQNTIKFDVSGNWSNITTPLNLFDYETEISWASTGKNGSYITLILPFGFSLKNYSLMSCRAELNYGNGYLRQWIFDASLNGKKWTLIEDVGETSELKDYKITTRKVDDSFSKMKFRYFRFKNKVRNYDGSWVMRILKIDFFGITRPIFETSYNPERNNFVMLLIFILFL